MSTSALGRVKTILVVDLAHVPNDPFATTFLGDLRARLSSRQRALADRMDNLLKVLERP